MIDPTIEGELFKYFSGIIRAKNSKLISAGGTEDHVHLLISLEKNCVVPKLIGDLKRSSSLWIKKRFPKVSNFYWQKGYGAFSIGQSQVPALVKYIENQKQRHKGLDYKDQLREILQKYEIDYDEDFIWD